RFLSVHGLGQAKFRRPPVLNTPQLDRWNFRSKECSRIQGEPLPHMFFLWPQSTLRPIQARVRIGKHVLRIVSYRKSARELLFSLMTRRRTLRTWLVPFRRAIR